MTAEERAIRLIRDWDNLDFDDLKKVVIYEIKQAESQARKEQTKKDAEIALGQSCFYRHVISGELSKFECSCKEMMAEAIREQK